MASYIKNLLKQLPFYGKTVKPRMKKFTDAQLLSELPLFEKSKKAKIKQLTTKKLLQEQPFYKQPIKKPRIKKLSNQELLRELPFYDDNNISRNKRVLRGYAKTYKVEIINNRNLSDSFSVSKNCMNESHEKIAFQSESTLYSCLNSLLEAGAKSEGEVTATGLEPRTT